MYLRTSAAVVLAASALGLAACGGDGADAGAQSSEGERRQAALKFAQCMREQGIDFPDPQAGGGPVRIGGEGTPEELRKAEQGCRKFRDDIEPPELSAAQQKEFKDAALAHARCMREHGVDFPDPTFSEDGGAQVRIGKGEVDIDDAGFKEAQEQCADKLAGIMERQP